MSRSALVLAVAMLATAAAAQPSAVHKTTLQQQDFPGPVYHTVTVRTVIAPGGQVAPHTHPGVEMAYVVSGRGVVKIVGVPAQPLAAGDSFSVPPRRVHSVVNTGPGPLTLVSTYVVDKSQPISSPAP
jgi:quercetin dioxygenase-like cupin family protein